jgi:serine protease Do
MTPFFQLDSPRGALVRQVTPSSLSARAGIRVGDIIIEVDEQEIVSADSLDTIAVGARQPARLTLLRDGKRMIVSLMLTNPETE